MSQYWCPKCDNSLDRGDLTSCPFCGIGFKGSTSVSAEELTRHLERQGEKALRAQRAKRNRSLQRQQRRKELRQKAQQMVSSRRKGISATAILILVYMAYRFLLTPPDSIRTIIQVAAVLGGLALLSTGFILFIRELGDEMAQPTTMEREPRVVHRWLIVLGIVAVLSFPFL